MITLSAPRKSGYRAEFGSLAEARTAAAELLGVAEADMIKEEY